jgi:hypothetical protein
MYARSPFFGAVFDTAMVDRAQAQLITAIGRTPSPFTRVQDWPRINYVQSIRSQELLNTVGREAWHEAGGIYSSDGTPGFTSSSPAAIELVREVATSPGGMLWTDQDGIEWAVRLAGGLGPDRNTLYGFAINWHDHGELLDPDVRSHLQQAIVGGLSHAAPPGAADPNARRRRVSNRLRLYRPAEQLLWATFAAVRQQRSSVVLLPDVMLGQVLWGGNRAIWPKNWRGEIFQILRSLSYLRSEVLRLTNRCWLPRLDAHSVAVAHVELVRPGQSRAGHCGPACPLSNRDVPHHHFLVQVGYGFLGSLERFASFDDLSGNRTFDFSRRPEGDAGEDLVAAQHEGALVQVVLPLKVFGPAPWSRLSVGKRSIVDVLAQEVTRAKKSSATSRPDRARLVIGAKVPGAIGRDKVVCPLLSPAIAYIAFGGNGRRAGMGYKVCGWLAKIGSDPSGDPRAVRRTARRFFRDLAGVAEIMGLVAVGLDPRRSQWFTLADLRQLAATKAGCRRLEELHLRIYGQEGCYDALRAYFAEQGGFGSIPGGAAVDGPASSHTDLDLRLRMQRGGVTQTMLAAELGTSQSFVSQILNGARPWPDGMRDRVARYIVEAAGNEKESRANCSVQVRAIPG